MREVRAAPAAALELDHLFVCAAAGAPEAERLAAWGLAEGSPNTHPGQGTACRRFFFRNAYLELLWVADEHEARSAIVAPTLLGQRWAERGAGASPFGVCLRASPDAANLPFATWEYRPPYLPPGAAIAIAETGAGPVEPMLFAIPFGGRPDRFSPGRAQPLEHPNRAREITGVYLTQPATVEVSPALRALERGGVVATAAGEEHLLEIVLDGGWQGRTLDLRPALPLRLRA